MNKNNLKFLSYCLLFFTTFLLILETDVSAKGKPSVYVVNYPLQYFTERIGEDLINVEFPAPKGTDPAYWIPSPETVRAYQKGDLIFLNGANYAKWTTIATLPRSKIVNTSKTFKDRYIKVQDSATHTHGPKGEHTHTGFAFTTWLDPALAIMQADSIKEALINLLPNKKTDIEKNFESLKNDLIRLDNQTKEIVKNNLDKPIIASHPVYQYFKNRYNLNLKSLHWEPDELPSEEQWLDLEKILKQHPSKWMIWESAPLKGTKNKLENFGIKSAVFDPCSNKPENGAYLTVMQNNIRILSVIFDQVE